MFEVNAKILAPVAKALPAEAMVVFCKAAQVADDNGASYNEAVIAGWAAVGEGWERPPTGKRWVRKDDPAPGDAHVPVPLGSAPPKAPKKPKPEYIDNFEGDEDEADVGDQIRVTGKSFESTAQVCKVDESLGLVFGFAIVCTKDGAPYYDLQGDHIPDDSMLKAAADFMENCRVAKDMHTGEQQGAIVFAFPLTADIAKSMEITSETTGLMIAMKPAPHMLAKFTSGEYTGFSIGGWRVVDEEVAA